MNRYLPADRSVDRHTLWTRVLPFLFLPIYGSGYIAGALGQIGRAHV